MPTPLLRFTPMDSVTLVFSDNADARWVEISELVDNTLATPLPLLSPDLLSNSDRIQCIKYRDQREEHRQGEHAHRFGSRLATTSRTAVAWRPAAGR